MRRVLRSLITVALLATLGATSASALAPDDAIRLTAEGVDDRTIMVKICSDGEAWDLSTDDIVYLRDRGVSDEVIQALMDPEGAAERYGLTLGESAGEALSAPEERTAYVFSLGYYYGPLARYYYHDPFFYPYLYSGRFAYGFSSWPSYYATYCWPYDYGYYPYPYFWYPYDSYYYGYGYCGPYYSVYYGTPPPGAGRYYGNVRWRDDAAGGGPPAYRSDKPRAPEYRSRGRSGGDPDLGSRVERRLSAKDPSVRTTPRESSGRTYERRGTVRDRDPGRTGTRIGQPRLKDRERSTVRPPERAKLRERDRSEIRQRENPEPRRPARVELRQPERVELRRPERVESRRPERVESRRPERVEPRQPARGNDRVLERRRPEPGSGNGDKPRLVLTRPDPERERAPERASVRSQGARSGR